MDPRVIVFMTAMAAWIVVGFVVASYAAHVFLVVIEEASAGNDRVVWPAEPYLDWAWKVVYLTWLLALPLLFAFGLTALAPTWLFDGAPVVTFLATWGLMQWLLFPVLLLSSMSSESRWSIYSPRVPAALVTGGLRTLAFYGLSGAILAAAVVIASGWRAPSFLGWGRAVVQAVLLGALLLIYARLLGRLAGALRRPLWGEGKQRARRRRSSRPEATAEEVRDPWAAPEAGRPQPSALPPIETPFEGAITGYDVQYEPRPEPAPEPQPHRRRAVVTDDEDDLPPPQLLPEGETPPGREGLTQVFAPTEYEMRLQRRSRPQGPRALWDAGVYGFPLYACCLAPVAWLTLGGTVLGILFRVMEAMRPA